MEVPKKHRKSSIENLTKALQALYQDYNNTSFKVLNTTEFCREHSLSYDTIMAIVDLNYLQKKGATRNSSYRWFPGRNEPHPKDAVAILDKAYLLRVERLANNSETTVKTSPQPQTSKPKVNKKPKVEPVDSTQEEKKVVILWGLLSWTRVKTKKK